MGLDVPSLDDREFEELFEELRRKIPVYSEEWSDHNTHDTGIAVLELLTWISETYTYQLDRVTDDHRDKYLKLLGVARQPPQAASAQVLVQPPTGVGGTVIPHGTKLTVDDRSGTNKTFETATNTRLTDGTITQILTHTDGDTVDHTNESRTEGIRFLAFGEEPTEGDALFLGFDADPFDDHETVAITVDFHEADLRPPATHGELSVEFEPSVSLAWDYCQPELRGGRLPLPTTLDDWQPLTVEADATNSLYEGGVVRLSTADTDIGATTGASTDAPVWIRCRIEQAGYEIPPQCNSLRVNVIETVHRATVDDETLERVDGGERTSIAAGQEFVFAHQPVLDAEIVINGTEWTPVDDFDRSEPTDTHYVLDHERGVIRFGNGITGAKPPVDRHVVAERYVYGGGTEGNVSRRSEWKFTAEDEPLTEHVSLGELGITPLGGATGGTAQDTVEAALDRFKRDLKRPYRAIRADDYRYIATHTPGLRFGRAEVAVTSTDTASGESAPEIHVVVVPYSPHPQPVPSPAFLEAVETHLDRTQLLTDRLRVSPPSYVRLDMTLAVSAVPEQTDQSVIEGVRAALTEFIHPLTGYDGEGWPFGRPLYISDLETVVESASGVDDLLGASVSAAGEKKIDKQGNVLIGETELLSLAADDVAVTVTSTAETREAE